MKVYLPIEVHPDGHTELLDDAVYRSEDEAKKQLYARTSDALRQVWNEAVEMAAKKHRNRVASEKRALTLHNKKALALSEAGFPKLAGKAPGVDAEPRTDESVPEFDVWLRERVYQTVLELDLN